MTKREEVCMPYLLVLLEHLAHILVVELWNGYRDLDGHLVPLPRVVVDLHTHTYIHTYTQT